MALGILMALAIGREAAAVPLTDPLDVQGLELANGQLMDRVPSEAWGHAALPSHLGLQTLRHDLGNIWMDWDAARQHVRGIMTAGVPAPGVMSNPSAAEAFAHDFFARHLSVLAPGSSIDDFVLVSNHLSAGIRTVGFVQHHAGRPVQGGQMSMRFKADQLVYVASQALPYVDVMPYTGALPSPAEAFASAQAFIEDDYPGATVNAHDLTGPSILPVWDATTGFSYHEVLQVQVDAQNPMGSWKVYLDAVTGDPIAREQTLHSAVTVQYNVPIRHPGSGRYDAPVTDMQVFEFGVGALTDSAGEVPVANDPTTLNVNVYGPLINVNNSGGPEASTDFAVNDGGTITWNDAGDQFTDAQLSVFVHASLAKAYVRNIDPALGWLDETLNINVNNGGQCNASSNGNNQLNFLSAGGTCENTARLADVVYHEAGHSVHGQSIIPGVGAFEGALSEGVSDYLAATIVDDSGMGRGFFYNEDPLRELNPEGYEWTWPQDKGEVHYEGQIIGGTLWDLRADLMTSLGDEAGRAQADLIYYEGHRRSVDIPTMFPEALVVDDDDGNLSNGTPNICEIITNFEAHGLFDPSIVAGSFAVDFSQEIEGGTVTALSSLPELAGCPIEIDGARLIWRERGEETAGEELVMDLVDGAFVATIPTQEPGTVVEYQVELAYTDGGQSTFPRNAADPWYQAFFGAVQPIYCLDDDADQGEWSFSGAGGNWNFGPLSGEGGVDPAEPWDDDGVLLQQEGPYPPGADTEALSPIIDISDSQDVRLHYRRWLTVEDGVFDQARIRVNGQTRWTNLFGSGNTNHIDHEWRFHDVPLSNFIEDGDIQLEFQLDSDGGLEFGGWTMDGLCVVEVVASVCGDGQVTGDETCDDENTEEGDGCDAECQTEEDVPEPTTGGEDDTDTGDADETSGGGSGAVDETGGPLTNGGSTSGDGDDDSTSGAPAVGDDGGCGCRSEPSEQPLRGGAWLLILAVAGLRRRRMS